MVKISVDRWDRLKVTVSVGGLDKCVCGGEWDCLGVSEGQGGLHKCVSESGQDRTRMSSKSR